MRFPQEHVPTGTHARSVTVWIIKQKIVLGPHLTPSTGNQPGAANQIKRAKDLRAGGQCTSVLKLP